MRYSVVRNNILNQIAAFKNEASEVLISDLRELSSNDIERTLNSNHYGHTVYGIPALNEILSSCLAPHLKSISQYLLKTKCPVQVNIDISTLDLFTSDENPRVNELLIASRFLNLKNDPSQQLQNSIVAANLELIRNIILALHSSLNKKHKLICSFCYRTTLGGKSCTHHQSIEGYDFRYIAKKTLNQFDNPSLESFNRFRFQKNNMEKNIFLKLDNMGDMTTQSNAFVFGDELDLLFDFSITSIENDSWDISSKLLMTYLENNAPNVFLKTQPLFLEAKSFIEFKKLAYLNKNILDNPNATSDSAYWFIRTILFAEFWLLAESLLERKEQEKQAVIYSVLILRNQGKPYREIGNALDISKSYVSKIIHEHRSDLDEQTS